ncbi:MAG TPA: peptide MFS transporter [Phycisphaerales bacterium]|nr:peptide MFS transporter [Phycisphaerales bacterium]
MQKFLGHPPGLFMLFFAEMWERFSYYGMRALLIFYMTKGFLGYGDKRAYAVYGAYTALVYATPFIGGMLADRVLGTRRAVLLGGLLMAAGHLLMTVENTVAFFGALALLICGNGFFKPNISTIVGSLYPKGSPKRDSGFTIFYIGINLGAALAPLICGYVGETFGWHYGFGLATIGMLIGVAVFVAPTILTQVLILSGSLVAAAGMVWVQRDDPLLLAVNAPVGVALIVAAVASAIGAGKGGLSASAGRPPKGREGIGGYLLVCLGTLAVVPLIALMVNYSDVAKYILSALGIVALGVILIEAFRGTKIERERLFVVLVMMFFSMLFWAFFEQAGSSVNNFTDRNVARVTQRDGSRTIQTTDLGASLTFTPTQDQLGYPFDATDVVIKGGSEAKIVELRVPTGSIAKAGDVVVVVRPAGDSPSGPAQTKQLTLKDLHPSLLEGTITWHKKVGDRLDDPESDADSLLSFSGRRAFTLDQLDALREGYKKLRDSATNAQGSPPPPANPTLTWTLGPAHVGMVVGGKEVPASVFQAVNPVCIMIFGLIFSALWGFLGRRNREPSTAIKFALGLAQLGLGFGVFWWAAEHSDSRGMASMWLLVLGYALHTTGELCLSPVGLSMVTRLSPTRIVSMVMGGWFLATAFSNLLAAIIAQFTGIGHGENGGAGIPVPLETVGVYGDVFGKIGIAAGVATLMLFALAPLLTKWMHRDADTDSPSASGGH